MTSELSEKQEMLTRLLDCLQPVVVAFSGGVDSAVVAKAAALACGENSLAVTADSPSLAEREREIAERSAREIGIAHHWISTAEFENDRYRANPSNRCYYCKTELYNHVKRLLPELSARFVNVEQPPTIVNGANWDDRGDHRPGMAAADEKSVRSPLLELEINKEEVRDLARAWSLSVWDKPAMPCLSSRIAYGLEVTPERVRCVDLAEQFLRDQFDLSVLRVRYEENDLARIEVPLEDLPRITSATAAMLIQTRLKEIGFRYATVDLQGFRSGSMNAVIAPEELQIHLPVSRSNRQPTSLQ